MKTPWIKYVKVCVVIAVVIIAYYGPGEVARYNMLRAIDKALLEATDDTPDYKEHHRLHFQNRISLLTLRDAIKEARIEIDIEYLYYVLSGSRTRPKYLLPTVFFNEQEIGDFFMNFFWHYPEDIRWHIHIDDKYINLIHFYWSQIVWEGGDGSGMSLKIGSPIEVKAARSYMLGIIDEALLEATEDTPDYLTPDRSRLYFRNSISLQTLRDVVKDEYIHYQGNLPPNPRALVSFIGEQEVSYGSLLYWEYEGIWWAIRIPLMKGYLFQIGETGEGFGMHQNLIPYARYITSGPDRRIISPPKEKNIYIKKGENVTLYANLDGSESLELVASYCPTNITVRKPGGNISLHLEYLNTPLLDPLVIPTDEAGTWKITVENVHTRTHNLDCLLVLYARPAAVKLDLPEVTDDPYLLGRLVAELPGTIVVTENGEPLSLSQPLANGRHDLRFQRVLKDGRESIVTRHTLIVDTLAPEITLGDFERETNQGEMPEYVEINDRQQMLTSRETLDISEVTHPNPTGYTSPPKIMINNWYSLQQGTNLPNVLLSLTLSDDVKEFYINGEQYDFGTGSQTEILASVPLEIGKNQIELRAKSFLGHGRAYTFTVTRTESKKDQI